MPPDSFLAIQKVANGWVALPDGASDVTAVVQVFTTPDDLAGFVMGWALGSLDARPVGDALARIRGLLAEPPPPPTQAIFTPGVIGPPTGPPAAEPPPVQPQFVTDQPAVAPQPPPPPQ